MSNDLHLCHNIFKTMVIFLKILDFIFETCIKLYMLEKFLIRR